MLLAELRKKLTGVSLETADKKEKIVGISTGVPAIDDIVENGGFPRGHITEIFGKPASGKTSLVLTFLSSAQKQGFKCYFANVERSVNYTRAQNLGIDLKKLNVIEGDIGEDYLSAIEKLCEDPQNVIVVDSLDALDPKADAEASIENRMMMVKAKLFSNFCRRVVPRLAKSKATLVCVNQLRASIGWGAKETTPGGEAFKYYAVLRLKMKEVNRLTQGENDIGRQFRAYVYTSKVGTPFKKLEIDFFWNTGFDMKRDELAKGLADGTITKVGNTYFAKDRKLGIGKEQARKNL